MLRLVSRTIRAVPVKLAIGGGVPGTPALGTSGDNPGRRIEACTPETPAIMTFTSGSTGEPNAAVRTHGFLLAQHRALADSLALEPGETDLTTLPIFLLANLASGLTSVIPDANLRAPARVDPARLLRQVRRTAPCRTAASPALLERLASYAATHDARLDNFRRIYTGGAPVFPRLLDALAAVAPRAAIAAVYGSTEAEPIAHVDRGDISTQDRAAMRMGVGLLAGPPVSSIQLRVLPDRWGEPMRAPSRDVLETEARGEGLAGEIVVTGPHVLAGYADGIGDEDTKFDVDGQVWHRTGDAGYQDRRGRVWLLGRCAARVQDRHGTLYPFAVECAASELAGVRRSAFVLHRDRRVLAVEPQGAEDSTLRGTLRDRLAWAHLDDVLIVRRIPMDRRHNAKVDYPALTRMLGAR